MKVRNTLNVLAVTIEVFPIYRTSAAKIEEPIKKLTEDTSRNDLKVLAERYVPEQKSQFFKIPGRKFSKKIHHLEFDSLTFTDLLILVTACSSRRKNQTFSENKE
jgi:hypothetical protein